MIPKKFCIINWLLQIFFYWIWCWSLKRSKKLSNLFMNYCSNSHGYKSKIQILFQLVVINTVRAKFSQQIPFLQSSVYNRNVPENSSRAIKHAELGTTKGKINFVALEGPFWEVESAKSLLNHLKAKIAKLAKLWDSHMMSIIATSRLCIGQPGQYIPWNWLSIWNGRANSSW